MQSFGKGKLNLADINLDNKCLNQIEIKLGNMELNNYHNATGIV